MPAISFVDFSGGLDRRLPINAQDASRLWTLKNAYVTLGKRIRKRPGLVTRSTGLTGSYGLQTVGGQLCVFCDSTTPITAPTGMRVISLTLPAAATAGSLSGIMYADLFQGFPYVVAKYTTTATTTGFNDPLPTDPGSA